MMQFPRDTMCRLWRIAFYGSAEHAIGPLAATTRSCPQPAGLGFLDFGPEAFGFRLGVMGMVTGLTAGRTFSAGEFAGELVKGVAALLAATLKLSLMGAQ